MRLTTIAASAAALALTAGGMAAAVADPGPGNGHNGFGLCTAYYAGSQNGQENKRKAPPFQALEEAADANGDDDGSATADEVEAFCALAENQRPGNGGGKPE